MSPLIFIRRLIGAPTHPPHNIDLTLPYTKSRMLAVDLEMNSLEVSEGEILSLGWVVIEKGEIRLGTSQHLLIDSPALAGESTRIHGIRDIDRQGGHSLQEGLETLHEAAENSILIFHHAALDLGFLHAAAAKTGLPCLRLPIVDTLVLEQRRKLRSGLEIKPGTLTLASCRTQYALPPAPQHNALEDALATAELALAMFSAISGPNPLPIKYFARTPKRIGLR